MAWPYFKNYLGAQLTDAEYENVGYPVPELTSHVTQKTIQAGVFLGVGLGALSALVRKRPVMRTAVRWGQGGVLFGVVAGPALTYAKLNSINWDQNGVYDRCYRLRKSQNQMRADRGFFLGVLSGAGAASLMGLGPVAGGILGGNAGLILAGVGNMTIWK